MSTKINVRSPYYVKISDSQLHSVNLDLYVWEGLQVSYYDAIDSMQDRLYLAITYGTSSISVSGIPSDRYGYVVLKFQASPTDGQYYAICYKDGAVYKEFKDITIDGSGYFTLSVDDMKDGNYTFDLFYGQNPTTINFIQLSGGYNDLDGEFVSGFSNAVTSISQTISYTETPDYATAKYTFTKTEVGSNNYVVFELSEYIKDYLVTKYGTYSTDVVWVKYDYQIYDSNGDEVGSLVSSTDTVGAILGVDGYGYFEDGVNPQLSQQLLQSNTILYYNEGQDIIFPIWAEFLPEINVSSGGGADIDWNVVEDFWQLYDVSWGFDFVQITDSGNTDQKIKYIRIGSSEELADGDTITITSETGGTTVITLEEICEPKYQPLNIIFYNKFGALQNVWFFKKSTTTLNVRSENYKRSIMDFSSTPTYSEQAHQVKTFNANGREVLQANTGFIDEQYNEVMKQLLMSEQVWVDNGTDVLPIRPINNSLTFKTSLNDKLINYTLDFEYAFDKINNIR